jgi:TolB-like protein
VADVFLSYVRSDRSVASALAGELEKAGFTVWWDRHIHAGADFSAEIEREIERARAVVVLWSASSRDSAWVRDEAAYARDRKKLVPVRIDAAEPPLGFRQVQSIDLIDWSANPPALNDLLEAIRDHLDAASSQGERSPLPRPATQDRAGHQRLLKRSLWLVGLLVLAISLAFIYRATQHGDDRADLASSTANIAPAKSIAVLPFTDMSEGKDREYLADGMTEEIINLLAGVPDLYVPARTSSFYFKGKVMKIADVARELGVEQVLEGSIRLSGTRLRVTAQLIHADSGYHVWSERFDRELHDIFAVQDEIANAVAQAMQIHVMGGPIARRKGGTQSLQAYELFLRGKSARLRFTRASLDESDMYLEQALRIDPTYGLARSLMALNALSRSDSGFVSPKLGYERGRKLAEEVLHLSPDTGSAHAVLLWVHRTLDWDWAAAEQDERRAMELDPHDPQLLSYAGLLAATLGRWDDAERKIGTALARDPLDTTGQWCLALTYYNAQRYSDAEATFRRLIELAPEAVWVRAYLAKALLAQGRPQEALDMIQQEADEWVRLWFLSIMLRAAGKTEAADEALNALIAETTEGSGPYFVAMNYAYRGDTELAFEWLERAYQEKDFALAEIVGEVLFANIARDSRFKAFLTRMKLPVKWTAEL